MSDPKALNADAVLARLDDLPTLPFVALRVGELVNDPRAGARDIAKVMRDDPSLPARVLKLVNSSYYAIPGGVADVTRAISFVGFNTLYQLVLSVSVLRALPKPSGSTFDAAGLWLHSLAVGSCAEVLARRIGHREPGACFTAGLLHDVGKIALAITAPDRFIQAVAAAGRSGEDMSAAEREAGLPPHDRVGSRLARRWKFPASLLVPIELHHDPRPEARRDLAPSLQAMVDVIIAADAICRLHHLGQSGSPSPDKVEPEILARIGLLPTHVDELYSQLMRRLEASKAFLELVDERPAVPAAAGAC